MEILITELRTIWKGIELSGANYQQRLLLLIFWLFLTAVVEKSEPVRESWWVERGLLKDLCSKLWNFMMSMLLLKRTPQLSLTQVTQIGRGGFFSRDPTLSVLLIFSSAHQARSPTSFLSGTPNFPSVNWTGERSKLSFRMFGLLIRSEGKEWHNQSGSDWRDRSSSRQDIVRTEPVLGIPRKLS